MNLLETLRNFKSVKPDPAYTEHSKRAILASRQFMPSMNPIRGILQFIETGAAVALTGFFILLASGALSNSQYIAPVQYSVIDTAGIHAEAQEIDVQIKLANVTYQDAALNNGSTAEAPTSAASPKAFSAAMTAATSSASGKGALLNGSAAATSSEAATSSPTIDGALKALSQ